MKTGKRLFDVVSCSLGLLVIWPFLLFIAILVKLEDGGPVLYFQERIGLCGRPFIMWKFRTMVVNADRNGQLLTVGRDARVTTVGRFLRGTKLDELPQLVNVLMGHMSLVGPRPEVGKYVKLYTPEQMRVLDIMPGITDPASIRYRDESRLLGQATDPDRTYVEDIMPEKIRLNLEYASRATVWTDLLVVLQTVLRVFA